MKLETSKKILMVSYCMAIIVALAMILATFAGYDTTNLAIVTSTVWAEAGVHSFVYSRKAAMENKLKIATATVKQLSSVEKFEPEHVIQIMDTITKE